MEELAPELVVTAEGPIRLIELNRDGMHSPEHVAIVARLIAKSG